MRTNQFIRRLCAGLRRRAFAGETLDELHQNLQEVIEMLLEDGEPELMAVA